MSIDKKQPQALDFEKLVLGAVIQSGECFEIVAPILSPEMFYLHAHKIIYTAIEALAKKREPIDVAMVVRQLILTGFLEVANGTLYVHDLMRDIASPANVESHARVIQEKFIKRTTIVWATSIVDQAHNDTYDIFDIQTNVRKLENFFSDQTTGGNQFTSISSLVKSERARYDERAASRIAGTPQGITTGLSTLNEITGGWQNGNLIILAARPAMGKTGLMLCFAQGAARAGRPVYIPTLEMTPDELTERILISDAEIDSEQYRQGDLDAKGVHKVESARVRVRDMGIFIDDTPAITTVRLKALCRKFCKEHPGGIIMVDYLQKMKVENERGKNRENQINEIAQELKNIARENKVPVIALSQLSREVEKRGDKRPMLSDLRESGAIEQEADVVIFLHRPEYYDRNDSPGVAELIIAKYRNGKTGITTARFVPEQIRFCDEETENYQAAPIQPNRNFYEVDKDGPF